MSGAEPTATGPSADTSGTDRDLELAIEKIEAQIEQVYRPLLKETVPKLEEQLTEKDQHIQQLEMRVDELEARIESLVGVPEEDASTHKKRVQDVNQILRRRADTDSDGRASMYWREIASSLAEHGHGELYDTQVKRAMEDVAASAGFTLATGKRDVAQSDDRSDVREVQVVQCDLDDVPGSDPVNNVVGGGGEGAASQNTPDSKQLENTT